MLIKKYQSGFTFTELMVALALNVFLLAALIAIFSANINHYRRSLNLNRLNQQLQTAMEIMVSDIRRAGYSATASNDVGTGQNNNAFVASGVDISTNVSNNCILFAYDHDNNGALPAVSSSVDDERYGFRVINQTLQSRPPGASFSCTANASDWENMIDPGFIEITNLTFTLTTSSITVGPGTQGLQQRSVDITLTGRLTSDTSITKTLTQHVRIRNDKFIP